MRTDKVRLQRWDLIACVVFSVVCLVISGVLLHYFVVFHRRRKGFGFRNRRTRLTLVGGSAALVFILCRIASVWFDLLEVWSGSTTLKLWLIGIWSFFGYNSLVFVALIGIRMWLIFFTAELAAADGDFAWISLITSDLDLRQGVLDRFVSVFVKYSRPKKTLLEQAKEDSFISLHAVMTPRPGPTSNLSSFNWAASNIGNLATIVRSDPDSRLKTRSGLRGSVESRGSIDAGSSRPPSSGAARSLPPTLTFQHSGTATVDEDRILSDLVSEGAASNPLGNSEEYTEEEPGLFDFASKGADSETRRSDTFGKGMSAHSAPLARITSADRHSSIDNAMKSAPLRAITPSMSANSTTSKASKKSGISSIGHRSVFSFDWSGIGTSSMVTIKDTLGMRPMYAPGYFGASGVGNTSVRSAFSATKNSRTSAKIYHGAAQSATPRLSLKMLRQAHEGSLDATSKQSSGKVLPPPLSAGAPSSAAVGAILSDGPHASVGLFSGSAILEDMAMTPVPDTGLDLAAGGVHSSQMSGFSLPPAQYYGERAESMRSKSGEGVSSAYHIRRSSLISISRQIFADELVRQKKGSPLTTSDQHSPDSDPGKDSPDLGAGDRHNRNTSMLSTLSAAVRKHQMQSSVGSIASAMEDSLLTEDEKMGEFMPRVPRGSLSRRHVEGGLLATRVGIGNVSRSFEVKSTVSPEQSSAGMGSVGPRKHSLHERAFSGESTATVRKISVVTSVQTPSLDLSDIKVEMSPTPDSGDHSLATPGRNRDERADKDGDEFTLDQSINEEDGCSESELADGEDHHRDGGDGNDDDAHSTEEDESPMTKDTASVNSSVDLGPAPVPTDVRTIMPVIQSERNMVANSDGNVGDGYQSGLMNPPTIGAGLTDPMLAASPPTSAELSEHVAVLTRQKTSERLKTPRMLSGSKMKKKNRNSGSNVFENMKEKQAREEAAMVSISLDQHDKPPSLRSVLKSQVSKKNANKYQWYLDHKSDLGNPAYIISRFLLINLIFTSVCVAFTVQKSLSGYASFPWLVWILAIVLLIAYVGHRYPKFDDHLLIRQEVSALQRVGIFIIVGELVFAMLNGWSSKYRNFWVSFARNWFYVGSMTVIMLVQTVYVLMMFQNTRSISEQDLAFFIAADAEEEEAQRRNTAAQIGNHHHNGHVSGNDEIDHNHNNEDQLQDLPSFANTAKHMGMGLKRKFSDFMQYSSDMLSATATVSANLESAVTVNSDSKIAGMNPTQQRHHQHHHQQQQHQQQLPRHPAMTADLNHFQSLKQLTSKQQLILVLRDEDGFRMMMQHLFKEFSHENLLAVYEFVQFRNEMRIFCKLDPNATEEDASFQGLFPEQMCEMVHSSIVYHKMLTKEQKYLALVDKYIVETAEMSVNVSHYCRHSLIELGDRIIENLTSFVNSDEEMVELIEVKYTVFDYAIRELLRLMMDSFERFRQTRQFRELGIELAKRVCQI